MSGGEELPPGRDATVSKTRATVISAAAIVVLAFVFGGLHAALWGPVDRSASYWIVWVLILLAGLVAHEATHALGFRLFGGVPWRSIRFGVIWRAGMPYAHAESPMPATGYRRAVLLPGLVTGVVPAAAGLAVGSSELSTAGAVLIGAAAGDWLVWSAVRSVPADTLVADHPTDVGAVVLDPPPAASAGAG